MNETKSTSESTTAVPAPTPEQHDMALEYDSMVLLSQLEQCVARLDDRMVQTSNALVLENLVGIVNHIAEFIERLPRLDIRRISLAVLLHKDQQNYTHLQPQHVRNNRLLSEPLAQLGLEGRERFLQILNDLLRVIRIYLLVCVKAFRTPTMGEQWRKLFGGFFGHVTKTMDEIKQRN